jgi:hypothetical protein
MRCLRPGVRIAADASAAPVAQELDVKLVIFDEVLDHILRIDRVLRQVSRDSVSSAPTTDTRRCCAQPLGHMLLVGASGAGKTILSKFVSWMNGMRVFQIKVPPAPAPGAHTTVTDALSRHAGAQDVQHGRLRQGSAHVPDPRWLQERAHLVNSSPQRPAARRVADVSTASASSSMRATCSTPASSSA